MRSGELPQTEPQPCSRGMSRSAPSKARCIRRLHASELIADGARAWSKGGESLSALWHECRQGCQGTEGGRSVASREARTRRGAPWRRPSSTWRQPSSAAGTLRRHTAGGASCAGVRGSWSHRSKSGTTASTLAHKRLHGRGHDMRTSIRGHLQKTRNRGREDDRIKLLVSADHTPDEKRELR